MSEHLFLSDGKALWPASDEAAKVVEKMAYKGNTPKKDRTLLVNVEQLRSMKQHNLFFALLKKVHDAGVYDGSFDAFRKSVLIECGYFEPVVLLNGTVVAQARSMRVVGGMGKAEFEDFFKKAVDLICDRLLGGISKLTLREEIEAMVDAQYKALHFARPLRERHLGPPAHLFAET